MALFESYERRIDKINKALDSYGISSLEEAKKICDDKGIDVAKIVKDTQPICFENACWAYTVGAAMAIKKGTTKAVEAAKIIGEGLQAFCIPGSVAADRKVGLGHPYHNNEVHLPQGVPDGSCAFWKLTVQIQS